MRHPVRLPIRHAQCEWHLALNGRGYLRHRHDLIMVENREDSSWNAQKGISLGAKAVTDGRSRVVHDSTFNTQRSTSIHFGSWEIEVGMFIGYPFLGERRYRWRGLWVVRGGAGTSLRARLRTGTARLPTPGRRGRERIFEGRAQTPPARHSLPARHCLGDGGGVGGDKPGGVGSSRLDSSYAIMFRG